MRLRKTGTEPLRGPISVRPETLARKDFTPAQKLVLGVVETLGQGSGQFWASAQTIARWLRVDPSTVFQAFAVLEQAGQIARDDSVGIGTAVVYRPVGLEAAGYAIGGEKVPVRVTENPSPAEGAMVCNLLDFPGGGEGFSQRGVSENPRQDVDVEEVDRSYREEETLPPPAPAQSEDLEAAVLSLLFPRGASQNQQRAIAGPVATLRAAGATAEFLALYLGRDLEGQPWVRLDRALAAWCADRSSRIKAEAEAEDRRRIEEAGKAAAGAPKDPPSPRLPGLAEAIRRLGVVEVFLRDQPGFKAKIISASADGILVESPAFPSPSRSTLRTDADLSRWNFGAAETGSPEAHP